MKRLNTFAKLGLATTMAFGAMVPTAVMMAPIHAEEGQMANMMDTQNIANMDIKLDGELKYNGAEQTQKIKFFLNNVEVKLEENKDYKVEGNKATEAGVYKMKITGINNYHGEKEVDYVVTKESTDPVNVCNFNVTLVNELKDNGTDQVQQIKVMFGDEEVKEGVDYTVTGNVARNAGAYNLTIHGMGRFVGDMDVPYIVAGKSHDQVNIANTNITLANSLTANGQAQTQKVRITCGDEILEEGKDYTLTNNTAKDAGTYTMTVNGKGQYVGSVNVDYTIAKAATPKKRNDVHTGEETNVGFFATIAGLSLAAMAAVIVYFNKKKA